VKVTVNPTPRSRCRRGVTVGDAATNMKAALASFALLAAVVAQDPADGWLAYSRVLPSGGKPGQRLTFIEAKWKNLGNPKRSSSYVLRVNHPAQQNHENNKR
jgi:hypothetical protein